MLDNHREDYQLFGARLLMKEGKMETGTQNEKGTALEAQKTGMQRFWNGFTNFMAMGGLVVFLAAFIAVALLVSYLTK